MSGRHSSTRPALGAAVVPARRFVGGTQRLDTLTSMRFFAAFSIMLMHSWGLFTGKPVPGPLCFSYVAVGFFFVLSGVVLTWSWRPGTGVLTQWRRRAARIVPLHWLMLVTAGLVMMLNRHLGTPGANNWHTFFVQLTLRQDWPPYKHWFAFDAPSWSLSAEAFFYALFPFVVPLVDRLGLRMLVVAAWTAIIGYFMLQVLLPMMHDPNFVNGGLLIYPPLHFLKFFVGVCIGCALRKGWRPRVTVLHATSLLALLLVGMTVFTTLPTHVGAGLGVTVPDCVALLPLILIVVAGAARDLNERAPAPAPFLVDLGQESFALYLVHWVVMYAFMVWIYRGGDYSRPVLGAGWLCGYLIVCVLSAKLLHHLYEKPLERVLRGRPSARHVRADRQPVPVPVPEPALSSGVP